MVPIDVYLIDSLICFMRQKLWWSFFAFIRTRLFEAVTWQVSYGDNGLGFSLQLMQF